MMQLGLVGLGAGAAAALLFASVTSGSWLSIILFYLAPLPIMIAGLGWSHWAAMIAALSGALAVGVVFGSVLPWLFLGIAGVPGWWLSYLAMLARPVAVAGGPNEAPHSDALEWYPAGRLVLWAAGIGILLVIIAIPFIGTDEVSFRAEVLSGLRRMFEAANNGSDQNLERMISYMALAIVPAAAVVIAIISLVNLWLGGRIVSFSHRLKRPWPDLSAITFPRTVIAMFVVVFAASFAGGMLGIVAGVASSALMLAYAVLGFAVLHNITRGFTGRPFMLGSVYASVPLLQGLPIFALCLIGICETAFDLRARVARRRGPQGRPPTVT